VTVSSALALAFIVIGLLAVVFALVVLWRRTPAAANPPVAPAQDRTQLEAASQEADQIRARAETEAAGILERAREEAEQAAQGRRDVEERHGRRRPVALAGLRPRYDVADLSGCAFAAGSRRRLASPVCSR